jgi:hypothetical protein
VISSGNLTMRSRLHEKQKSLGISVIEDLSSNESDSRSPQPMNIPEEHVTFSIVREAFSNFVYAKANAPILTHDEKSNLVNPEFSKQEDPTEEMSPVKPSSLLRFIQL